MREFLIVVLSAFEVFLVAAFIRGLFSKEVRDTLSRCVKEDARRREKKKAARRKSSYLTDESYRRFGPFRNTERVAWIEREEEKEMRRIMRGKY